MRLPPIAFKMKVNRSSYLLFGINAIDIVLDVADGWYSLVSFVLKTRRAATLWNIIKMCTGLRLHYILTSLLCFVFTVSAGHGDMVMKYS